MEISLKYGLKKIGLPIVVTENKPNLCFLIDTGASNNILFSYAYAEVKDDFSTINKISLLSGIDGIKSECFQVHGKIIIDNQNFDIDFSVVETADGMKNIQNETGVQVHGILGVPFLTLNKWIIDFKNLTITQ